MNPLGDLVAVLLSAGEGPQNEQLEGPLEKLSRFVLCSHKQFRVVSPKHIM